MNAETLSLPRLDTDAATPGVKTVQISFIIPVYNVEKYIRECVLSILELEDISFEVILIDDGSTDKSIEKIADLINENPSMTALRQENRGQSAARNRGLELAKGDYIVFVDSDDKIDASALQRLFLEKQGNEDILIGDLYTWDGNDTFEQDYPSLFDRPTRISGELLFQQFYLESLLVVICRNIYKTSFIRKHRLSFLEGAYYEDHDWAIRCLVLAKDVLYVNQAIYFYRNRREGSTMNSPFSSKKYHDLFKVSQSLQEFASEIENKKTAYVVSLTVAYLLIPALRHAKTANLDVDHGPVLNLYKKLRLPFFCRSSMMQYVLAVSKKLFFKMLEKQS